MTGFRLKMLAAVAGLSLSAAAHAQIINSATPIPDSEVLLNFNGSGLDWVYAGPVAPNEFGFGEIQSATYRAGEGWRIATAAEWLAHPIWSDFTRTGFATPSAVSSFSDHSSYLFTSEYWSTFTHVDLNDFAAGRVTDGVNGVTSNVPETIYVRSSILAAVPEPGTWMTMLLGFGLVGGAMRVARRKRITDAAFAY